MNGTTVRITLLAGLGLVCCAVTAHAQPCPPAPCATVTKKVLVTEYKMEPYEATRTVMKTEWKDEKYTAYKCEMVPQEHTYYVVYCKSVPVEKEVEVIHFECVPEVVDKKVTRLVVKCVPVEKEVTRCVDAGGHYECREVPCQPERHGLLHRLCHKDDCEEECMQVRVVSVYVPKMVTVKDKVMVMKRVCEPVTETIKVTILKPIEKKEKVKITVCETKTETKEEKCTIYVPKTTPYEATRKVAVCTPVQEKVKLYRCVPVQVEKEVTCVVAAPTCECPCTHSSGHRRLGLFHRGGCQ